MEFDMSISELLTKYPEYADYFMLRGLPSDINNLLSQKLTLRMVLQSKRINETAFTVDLTEYMEDRKSQLIDSSEIEDPTLFARIPCIVQLPFQKLLRDEMNNAGIDLPCNIALVRFGKAWVDEVMEKNPPPVFVGAGVEGMVKSEDLTGGAYGFEKPYAVNKDYEGFQDPRGIFRFISGIPVVMVVDNAQLGGRKKPVALADLLTPEFEKSVIYPDDGDILNGMFMTYFQRFFGDDGMRRFGRSCICGVHPSQMIKVGGLEERPAVMLMPHIFAAIKTKESGMELVWPEEGAPILPILITESNTANAEEQKITEMILSREMGEIFVKQGMFPSAHPGVENDLPGKLLWIGWKYLYETDIFKNIDFCRSILKVTGAEPVPPVALDKENT